MIAAPKWTRRSVLAALPALGAAPLIAGFQSRDQDRLDLILAPSNLGLRPLRAGHQPGTWRAPQALQAAGLARAVGANRIIQLGRPQYRSGGEQGTRIRNGHTIRRFSEGLGKAVAEVLRGKAFPLVIGGDCSILLGCLYGTRALGRVGLVHVDGHSDFYHPGNYDTQRRLGSAAGMDLALATGRGEALLSRWDGTPLVEDRFVVQIGEREALEAGTGYGDILRSQVRRLPVRTVLEQGIKASVERALAPVGGERRPIWLHIDLDVLDGHLMPAVDSPGTPGFRFDQLAELVGRLIASQRVIGAGVAIFDPDLDRSGQHARAIVAWLSQAFSRRWSRP